MNRKRSFDSILDSLKDSIATYDYYVDFAKVYFKTSEVYSSLELLKPLLGSDVIETKFEEIVSKHPQALNAIPILLAVRDKSIKIIDKSYKKFDFLNNTNSIDDYLKFMKETGLFNMLQELKITSLTDYVTGVEVGLDSNARKNRTGKLMEKIVEDFILDAGFSDMEKQANIATIAKNFKCDSILRYTAEDEKANKVFDFAFKNNDVVYVVECSFYSGGGSKLNETARSYSRLAQEIKTLENVEFIWITDGVGWLTTKKQLREAYEQIDHLYTIKDLEDGVLSLLG